MAYYTGIVKWLINEIKTYPNGGRYPIGNVAKKETESKFIQYAEYYERERRVYHKRGLYLDLLPEITFTEKYDYLIIHGTWVKDVRNNNNKQRTS